MCKPIADHRTKHNAHHCKDHADCWDRIHAGVDCSKCMPTQHKATKRLISPTHLPKNFCIVPGIPNIKHPYDLDSTLANHYYTLCQHSENELYVLVGACGEIRGLAQIDAKRIVWENRKK